MSKTKFHKLNKQAGVSGVETAIAIALISIVALAGVQTIGTKSADNLGCVSSAGFSSGDFNGDGTVNIIDLLKFRQAYNTNSSLGDFNCDGFVGPADLERFRELWNQHR